MSAYLKIQEERRTLFIQRLPFSSSDFLLIWLLAHPAFTNFGQVFVRTRYLISLSAASNTISVNVSGISMLANTASICRSSQG
jgi:hypothetical protein